MKDARLYQVLFLGLLLSYGVFFREFSLRPGQMALCFASGLATQAFFIRLHKLPWSSLLSAMVTCFGLSLLLRADNFWAHPAAAALAISSKFFIRISGKHLFNPANLGVILSLIFLPGTWVSAGQWGNDLALAGWIGMLGFTVTRRASRLDISWAFLICFLGLCALRALYLGQPLKVWEHQAQGGGLLLFSFFMISDPRTTPKHPIARWIYAACVALAAFAWQFAFFRVNGMIWSLFYLCPLVPLLDLAFKSQAFAWDQPVSSTLRSRHA